MDIRIKATDFTMTPEIETYLSQRVSALEKLIDKADVTRCEVELGRDAGRPRHGANIYFAEMRVAIPGEGPVYARNNAESINGAIDDVKEETERQLRKGKKLHTRLMRKGGAVAKRLMRFGH